MSQQQMHLRVVMLGMLRVAMGVAMGVMGWMVQMWLVVLVGLTCGGALSARRTWRLSTMMLTMQQPAQTAFVCWSASSIDG
jgi:hypothetical protein